MPKPIPSVEYTPAAEMNPQLALIAQISNSKASKSSASAICGMWALQDLNLRPADYESAALTKLS